MIRPADERDCEGIRRLIGILENTAMDPERFSAVFREQLAAKQYICLVDEENGILRGMVNFSIEAELHHVRKTARIHELVVDPSLRCQGIGKALFLAAEQCARDADCEVIELETSVWRKRAHAFYEREGMTADHYYYRKRLD